MSVAGVQHLEPLRDFAMRVSDVAEGSCPCAPCLRPLLRADRIAVRLALLSELADRLLGQPTAMGILADFRNEVLERGEK